MCAGKTAVQPSCSKRARRNPSPKMIKLTVHEEARGQWKNDQTLNIPHTITTARRTDNIPLICTGAGPIHPVHSPPMSLATEALPETRFYFCHFPAVFHTYTHILYPYAYTFKYMYVCVYIYTYTLSTSWLMCDNDCVHTGGWDARSGSASRTQCGEGWGQ